LLELYETTQFKKDLKRVLRRKLPIHILNEVILMLRQERALDPRYCDHALTGKFKGLRECHLQPDWLLIYGVDKDKLVLTASRTGSHSDLF